MAINEAGLALVKQWEGLYLNAYRCAAGVWTIGYGHTGTVDGKKIRSGMTITKARAESLLAADLALFWGYVVKEEYVPLTAELNENQKSALCSFAFNCGSNSLKTLCKNRSAEEIAEALLLYNKAAGKVLPGLTARRKAERELFLRKGGTLDMSELRRGDRGQQVKALQKLVGGLTVDGIFGTDTETAVKALQGQLGLAVDGIVGPKTWEKILGNEE